MHMHQLRVIPKAITSGASSGSILTLPISASEGAGANTSGKPLPLFADPIVPLGLLKLRDLVRRQLRPVDGQRDLVQLTGESERRLVVVVVDRRAGVGANVQSLVPLQDERNRMLHFLGCDDIPVDLQDTGTALADASVI